MTNAVNGGAEDQVFQAGMSVRPHDHQIGLERASRANDFGFAGLRPWAIRRSASSPLP